MINEYPGLRDDRNIWMDWNLSKKQIVAIVAPIFLTLSMYVVFQFFSSIMGDLFGWYCGLILYWITWGALFPLWMLGKTNILKMIRPQRINLQILLLVSFPLLMASMSKLIPELGTRRRTCGSCFYTCRPQLGMGPSKKYYGEGFI